jgi:hypothetical protein
MTRLLLLLSTVFSGKRLYHLTGHLGSYIVQRSKFFVLLLSVFYQHLQEPIHSKLQILGLYPFTKLTRLEDFVEVEHMGVPRDVIQKLFLVVVTGVILKHLFSEFSKFQPITLLEKVHQKSFVNGLFQDM